MLLPAINDLEMVGFHPKHLEIMVMREEEKEFIGGLESAYEKIEILAQRSIEAITLMQDGRIITCCGFVKMFPGVYELWQIPSIYAKRNPLYFAKSMKVFVESIAEAMKAVRLQTISPADELHTRWMEWLGFKCEGTNRLFNGVKDYKMWARIFERA